MPTGTGTSNAQMYREEKEEEYLGVSAGQKRKAVLVTNGLLWTEMQRGGCGVSVQKAFKRRQAKVCAG